MENAVELDRIFLWWDADESSGISVAKFASLIFMACQT
jgi:hypothetical protein